MNISPKTLGRTLVLAQIAQSNSFISHDRKFNEIVTDATSLLSIPPERLQANLRDITALVQNKVGLNVTTLNGLPVLRVTTPDHSTFELRQLHESNEPGFHAAAFLMRKMVNDSKEEPPPTLKLAFGGTSTTKDFPRTLAMQLTQQPMLKDKEPFAFLKRSLKAYKKTSEGQKPVERIELAAHSAGAPAAMRALKILREHLPKANIGLNLYEPFGAKFGLHNVTLHQNVSTYIHSLSLLPKMKPHGSNVGDEYVLPQTNHTACNNPIDAHRMICLLDAANDLN